MNLLTKSKFVQNVFNKKTQNVITPNLTLSLSRYYSDSFQSVKSKVIVITGGNNLPTLNLAANFADAGAQAVILGTPPNEHFIQATNKLNRKRAVKVIVEPCDLTKKSHIKNLFKIATKLFNKVDLVVNSADADGQIDITISTNISSVVLGTLTGFHFMGTNTGGMGGTIINICSIFGLDHFFGSPVYSGAKSFIIGFSRSMGTDCFYKLTNVKLLTVCVGVTNINTVPSTTSVIPGFDSLNYDKIKHMEKKPVYKEELLKNCLSDMLVDGENGSVWIVENEEYFKANMPESNVIKIPVEI